MKKTNYSLNLIVFMTLSCTREYGDPSSPYGNAPPETYLTLIAQDTIWVSTVVSEETGDTNVVYLSSVFDSTIFEVDTTFFENEFPKAAIHWRSRSPSPSAAIMTQPSHKESGFIIIYNEIRLGNRQFTSN